MSCIALVAASAAIGICAAAPSDHAIVAVAQRILDFGPQVERGRGDEGQVTASQIGGLGKVESSLTKKPRDTGMYERSTV